MDYIKHLKEYMDRDAQTLKNSCFENLDKVANILMDARAQSKWIFSAGNGGSSATASHFGNDFVKGLSVEGKKRFKVLCLNDSTPIVTALANDYDYSLCFVESLKNYASAGDVLVAYSGSGNSPNIVKVCEYAKSIGMTVIGFTGRDGGKMDAFCDVNCIAATDCMEEIEDVHMVWEHAMIMGLRRMICEEK